MIKLKHSGKVWKKVIKQKYPGAVSNGARVNKESYKEKNKSKRNKREKTEGDLLSLFSSLPRAPRIEIKYKILQR